MRVVFSLIETSTVDLFAKRHAICSTFANRIRGLVASTRPGIRVDLLETIRGEMVMPLKSARE
jgi:hypothetical protein